MSIETPAALYELSDFAEHMDGSGQAWAAFQEVDAHITALHSEVERLQARVREYETRLTAVMPPDMKDWHENSPSEWPEIAAAVITNLRESELFFIKAFERSDARERELEASRDFSRRRCDALQAAQRHMRDPERKVVCDILANGTTYIEPYRAALEGSET